MILLTWDNKQDAEASLDSVEAIYGCPYLAENGYKMDQWDFVTNPFDEESYGFFAPDERLGHGEDELMMALVPGHAERPAPDGPYIPDISGG